MRMERDEFAEFLARSYSCGCLEIRPDQIANILNSHTEYSMSCEERIPSTPVITSRQMPDQSQAALIPQSDGAKLSSPRKRRFKAKKSRNGAIQRSQSCRRPNEGKPKEPKHVMKPLESTQSCENIEKHVQETEEDSDENPCKIYRVRSFKSSSSGLINRGDSFKVKSPDLSVSVQTVGTSSEEATLIEKRKKKSAKVLISVNVDPASCYSVMVLGAPGVGKTSLIQQFSTSECIANQDAYSGKFYFYQNLNCSFFSKNGNKSLNARLLL